MPKNSFLQAIFKGPKFSLAPIEHNNRGNVKIGAVVPVFSRVLNQREGLELNMAHLVRFMPAKAPTMEGYKVTFDAFAVPYSTLGYAERKERDIDDFFNVKTNGGEVVNPFGRSMQACAGSFLCEGTPKLLDLVTDSNLHLLFKNGSLADYMEFPSLKTVKEHIRKWLNVNPLANGNSIEKYVTESNDELLSVPFSYIRAAYFGALSYMNDRASFEEENVIDLSGLGYNSLSLVIGLPFSVSNNPLVVDAIADNSDLYRISFSEESTSDFGKSGVVGCYSLLGYILRNYPAVASYYGFDGNAENIGNYVRHLGALLDSENSLNLDYLQVLYDNYKIDAQSIFDEYFDFVCSKILYNNTLTNDMSEGLFDWYSNDADMDDTFLPTLPASQPIDLSYFAAYWKIISDWYINTNIDGDPDDFYLEHCRLLTDSELDSRPYRWLDMQPFVRRWSNDVFTSAVPMAQVNNVRIPANGTIPDLREANAFQKLVDIFRNTGNRLRDVVYGLRGVTPSAVRSEMSEPIGSFSSWVGIQSVLQTSQTTKDSPQAAYAGIGTDSDGFKHVLKYVNNDEPTPVIVMILMSVTQHASYMQGFDRKFFRNSIYDFAIPQLSMIGEQEIRNSEVYFDKNAEFGTFGFNRRYYDWFYQGSSVHGDLRDSLDYWHGARIFDEQPALNSEFIGINSDIDHLQRIFANVSESSRPIVYNLSFDGYATVALPRYIQYEL